MSKNKFYVVWDGKQTGIFTSWEECSKQVLGVKNARYKAFNSLDEANKAYHQSEVQPSDKLQSPNILQKWDVPCVTVDGACSGNPGTMEYRGIHLPTNNLVFHDIFPWGTNNIAEFLAIVEGLKYTTAHNITLYSDSTVAIAWVSKNRCNTTLTNLNEELKTKIRTAENWLKLNENAKNLLKKWNTSQWGEIPADFGRK